MFLGKSKMNKSLIILTIIFCFAAKNIIGQTVTNKTLFFYQDSTVFVNCGTITYADVLFFVADTTQKKQAINEYYIVIECPELYGKDFFTKGAKYKLVLTKNYKKISKYFSKNIYLTLRKRKNLYLCDKIEKL